MIIETLLVFLAAVIAGAFSGIMPGIGGFVMLTLAYPLLVTVNPVNVILFYIVLVSIDQYYNGISAIAFGIPSGPSGVPSQIEGHTLFRQGHGEKAIMFSAISSFFASISAVLFIATSLSFLDVFYKIWSTDLQMAAFTVATAGIIFFSQNKFYWNAILFAIGLFLGKIGYDEIESEQFFTFGQSFLYSGLPTLAVILSFFIVPSFIRSYRESSERLHWPTMSFSGYFDSIKEMSSYVKTLLRSSFIGAIGGFVPGLTYGASTILAYYTEKMLVKKNSEYQKGNMQCLIAAEGSNNAGAYTQMTPLLMLGIPITASEALLYNILEYQRVTLTIEWFQSTMTYATVGFILSSVLGLFIAGKYVNILKFLDNKDPRALYFVVIAIVLSIIYFMGAMTNNGISHLLIALTLVPVGALLNRYDTSPLLFGFFLQDKIFDVVNRFIIFYI